MKVGDLVRMDFSGWLRGDERGVGIILNTAFDPASGCDDVEVLWSKAGVSWEISMTLDELTDEQLEHVRGGMGSEVFELWRSDLLNEDR